MRGFDARFIEELKNKNDVVDIIGRYVRLEQKGGNFWEDALFIMKRRLLFALIL